MIYLYSSTTVRSRIVEWSRTCLQERIHSKDGGMMRCWFKEELQKSENGSGSKFRTIAIAKTMEGETIGVAVQFRGWDHAGWVALSRWDVDEYNVSIYVKPEHRRRGVGKRLIQKLQSRSTIPTVGSPHNDETRKFFTESGA